MQKKGLKIFLFHNPTQALPPKAMAGRGYMNRFLKVRAPVYFSFFASHAELPA